MRCASAVLATVLLAVVLPDPTLAQEHAHDHASPYADFTDREIKALSAEELAGLLAGEGLGMALPAELNGLPGPRHVLDMAPMLELDDTQRVAIQAIFDAMQEQARELGAEVVELERLLDEGFANDDLTEDELVSLLAEIGDRRARLRAVHLIAHLRVTPLLTEAQKSHYRMARGYGG